MKRSLPGNHAWHLNGTVFSPLYVLQNQKDADCIASLNSFDTCNIARDCVCSACVACLNIPYLFGYKPISAISRDPKLLTQKINLINPNCKCIILGYKPRAIFGLEDYRRP